jgi:lysophospholipase L1-like esterase
MLGDSIFDGRRSTLDANRRYPDLLARRLGSMPATTLGVLNMGLAGGRVLNDAPCCGASALGRLQHDVLDQPNVSHLVLLEGVNDVSFPQMGDDVTRNPLVPVTAAQVIDGFQRIIAAAQARKIKVIGATVLPYRGAAAFTPEGEAMREQLNVFIRSGAFDGVMDLDAVMRDPAQPDAMLPDYVSMDKLHPTDRGYQLMANAVDLGLFQGPPGGRPGKGAGVRVWSPLGRAPAREPASRKGGGP